MKARLSRANASWQVLDEFQDMFLRMRQVVMSEKFTMNH